MASSSHVFELRLVLSTRGVTGAAGRASRGFQTMEKSIHDAMQQMITFNTVSRIGKRMLMGAGSIAQGLLSAAKEAVDLDITLQRAVDVYNDFAKATRTATIDVDKLRQELLNVASAAIVTEDALVKTAEQISFSGLGAAAAMEKSAQSGEKSMAGMANAINQIAFLMGDTTPQAVTEYMASLQMVKGVSGSAEERIRKFGQAALLARTRTRAHSDELFKVTGRLALAMEQWDVAPATLFAMSSALLQGGQSAERSRGAMGKLIITMAKMPEQMEKALNIEGLAARIRGGEMDVAIFNVLDVLKKIKAEKGVTGLAEALEDTQLNAVRVAEALVTMGGMSDWIKKKSFEFNEALSDGSRIQEKFDEQAGRSSTQAKVFSDNLEILRTQLGLTFIRQMADVISNLYEFSQIMIANKDEILPGVVKGLIYVAGAMALVGATMVAIGASGMLVYFGKMLLPMIWRGAFALNLMAGQFMVVGKAAAMGSEIAAARMAKVSFMLAGVESAVLSLLGPFLILGALVGIVATALVKNWGGAREFFGDAAKEMLGYLRQLWLGIRFLGIMVIEGLVAPFGSFKNFIEELLVPIKLVTKQVLHLANILITGLAGAFTIVGFVLGTVIGMFMFLVRIVTFLWSVVYELVNILEDWTVTAWLVWGVGKALSFVIGLVAAAFALQWLYTKAATAALAFQKIVQGGILVVTKGLAYVTGIYSAIQAVFAGTTTAAAGAATALDIALAPIFLTVTAIAAGVLLLIFALSELLNFISFGAVPGFGDLTSIAGIPEFPAGGAKRGGTNAAFESVNKQKQEDAAGFMANMDSMVASLNDKLDSAFGGLGEFGGAPTSVFGDEQTVQITNEINVDGRTEEHTTEHKIGATGRNPLGRSSSALGDLRQRFRNR